VIREREVSIIRKLRIARDRDAVSLRQDARRRPSVVFPGTLPLAAQSPIVVTFGAKHHHVLKMRHFQARSRSLLTRYGESVPSGHSDTDSYEDSFPCVLEPLFIHNQYPSCQSVCVHPPICMGLKVTVPPILLSRTIIHSPFFALAMRAPSLSCS